MVVGVNGTGKTTTIGKLAAKLKAQGKKVILAAGDTFRAAAAEQLDVWADRAQVPMVRGKDGSDPGAVLFDAVEARASERLDVVLCDTAGRLHTKANLMEELKKVKRVLARRMPGAPHEVLLVLDATTGQNAIQQAQAVPRGAGRHRHRAHQARRHREGRRDHRDLRRAEDPGRYVGVGEKVADLQAVRRARVRRGALR